MIENQFQLIRGLTMRKPQERGSSRYNDVIQGYNNFVSSLSLVRKYRPFNESDNLPKICQHEDHFEVSSPRSSSSGHNSYDQEAIEQQDQYKTLPPQTNPDTDMQSTSKDSQAGPNTKISLSGRHKPKSKVVNEETKFSQMTQKAEEQ